MKSMFDGLNSQDKAITAIAIIAIVCGTFLITVLITVSEVADALIAMSGVCPQ